MMIYMHLGYSSVMEAFGNIFWSGALDRYPRLRLVSVEGDLGWIPHFKRRAEKMFARHGDWLGVKSDPSEWFGRNFFATFESDSIGLELRDVIGVESIMWAADYPHSASSFPGSMQQIKDDLVILTQVERRKITWENVQKLYGIEFSG